MKIAVLGAGAFGGALAKVLEGRGHDVTVWMRSAEQCRSLETTRASRYLPGVIFGEAVRFTVELDEAVTDAPIVLAVVPSQGVRNVMTRVAEHLAPDAVVVNASKGFELSTNMTIDEIYAEVLPAQNAASAAFLSGPTFARELAARLPSAIVVASRSADSAALVQREFATDRLRVYTSDDVAGVEVCGALKNVCAIGAGIGDGVGFGNNARAALITRGLAEIIRFGTRVGAHPQTFAGLAGMGDLLLTCTGDLSRNRRLGIELGKGKSLDGAIESLGGVAEGVKTCAAAHELAAKLDVEMPLTDAIYRVLYEDLDVHEAMDRLMTRGPKSERA